MNLNKIADKAQDVIEAIDTKENKEDMEHHVPALIWMLKIILILWMFYLGILAYYEQIMYETASFGIAINALFLYTILRRRTWGYFYGLTVFTAQLAFMYLFAAEIGIIGLLFLITPFTLFMMHKDYFDR